ncbi:MAG: site-specific integrase [Bacteroidales bacterium]|nr:site-specific integrase [Bacteroidales bacterium]
MSVTFKIRTRKKEGRAPLVARILNNKLQVDILVATTITVDVAKFTASPTGRLYANYMKSPEGVKVKELMASVTSALESYLRQGVKLTTDQARKVIDDIVMKEEREAEIRREEERRRKEEEERRVTLNKFIGQFIADIESGARQTDKGTNYAFATVKAIKQALRQFKYFQRDTKKEYDFDDIDMSFYYKYTAYLKNKNYSVNSIGKCIKELKAVMYIAEIEGHHSNNAWKDKKFKGTRIDIDSIYLTEEELDRMMSVDLSRYEAGHELARDIFMVGVWTAQRVSDYNNIRKEDFSTLVKNVMREEDDPEHPGEKRAWIEKHEITYLNVRQKKTGARVAIPCNSRLKAILEKYDYQLPHLEDQVINRYIKDVAQAAGLTDLVEIETTKGGTARKEMVEKYKLIHTHTARRTGATLMYLSGVDIYDIMKVTGHTSPAMLKKYIKADSLKVVEKLTDKYDYFK